MMRTTIKYNGAINQKDVYREKDNAIQRKNRIFVLLVTACGAAR